MYKSYQLGVPLTIGGVSSFNFIDDSGGCVGAGQTSPISYSVKYRMNLDIVCTGSSNNINLYNNLFGKVIPSYYSSTETTILIPSQSGSFNEAIIYIFLAEYGSMHAEYIQNVQVRVSQSSSSNSQTLRLRFINPSKEVQQQESSPSFFPQIPTDIFFPVQQIAYSI
jgi:hypothetical protein